MSLLQMNGEQPQIIGAICEAFVVQSFYDGDRLADPANVVFMKFSELWVRVYFETNTVFWRTGMSPGQPINSTLEHGLLLNDLSEMSSVVGRVLSEIQYRGTETGDVELSLIFAGGATVCLRYDNTLDATSIDV